MKNAIFFSSENFHFFFFFVVRFSVYLNGRVFEMTYLLSSFSADRSNAVALSQFSYFARRLLQLCTALSGYFCSSPLLLSGDQAFLCTVTLFIV